MYTTYKLSDDDSGLNCTANGLAIDGLKLVAKSAVTGRFECCNLPLLQKSGITIPAGRLHAVANALNQNNTSLAMIAALHLMPALGPIAKAGYRDDEPRDDHGRWTTERDGDSDDSDETSSSPNENNSGYQLAAANADETPEQRRAKEERFVDAHYAETEVIAKQLNVPVENILSVAADESGWGTSPAAKNMDNYFGLHSPAPFENPKKKRKAQNSNAYIAGFDSYNDSLKSLAAVSGAKITGIDDPVEFATALQGKKFGVHDDGSAIPYYVSSLAATIRSVRAVTNGRKL